MVSNRVASGIMILVVIDYTAGTGTPIGDPTEVEAIKNAFKTRGIKHSPLYLYVANSYYLPPCVRTWS
jgi:hypothetical protein